MENVVYIIYADYTGECDLEIHSATLNKETARQTLLQCIADGIEDNPEENADVSNEFINNFVDDLVNDNTICHHRDEFNGFSLWCCVIPLQ